MSILSISQNTLYSTKQFSKDSDLVMTKVLYYWNSISADTLLYCYIYKKISKSTITN